MRPMPHSQSRVRVASILILPLALMMAACDVATTKPGADATQGAQPNVTATTLRTPVNCAQNLPGMQDAQVVESTTPTSLIVAGLSSPSPRPPAPRCKSCSTPPACRSLSKEAVTTISRRRSSLAPRRPPLRSRPRSISTAVGGAPREISPSMARPFSPAYRSLCYTTDSLQHFLSWSRSKITLRECCHRVARGVAPTAGGL